VAESTENGGEHWQQSPTGIVVGPRVGAAEEDGRVRDGGGVQKARKDGVKARPASHSATQRGTAALYRMLPNALGARRETYGEARVARR
jgi:hypothetical protein